MLKILDMPKGGGADHGRTIWFSLMTEDGQEHTFELEQQHLASLVKGLEHFASQAKALREANGEAHVPAPPPVAEKVRSRKTADGGVELAVGLKGQGMVEFVVHRPALKVMLGALESALEPPAATRR